MSEPIAEEINRISEELRPDANGKYPEITPQLLKKLRGKYFTVRHVVLENCGHRLDMINQPKTNCENCWWQWLLHHPQLVETTDQFFRTHGKEPLVGMRGERYFKMFVRFMSTYLKFQQEVREAQEKANESSSGQEQSIDPAVLSNTTDADAGVGTPVESREVESCG